MEPVARPWRCRIAVSAVIVGCLTLVASSVATAAVFPNPCALLTAVHAEKTLTKGRSVVVKHGKLVKSGAGSSVSLTCSEMVGTQPLFLTLSHSSGGFGGIKITSTTHPTGLGSGDVLVVGTGPTGGPIDFILFHKNTVYADISANGANPRNLTILARQLYKLIH